eukprot:gene21213-41204_t
MAMTDDSDAGALRPHDNTAHAYDLVIRGGSVIDGTKFVAAAALFGDEDPWLILKKGGTNITAALPIGAYAPRWFM